MSDLPVHAGEPRNAELEAAVLADPQDRLAWRIYADWLIDQGSVRGELVASMAGFDRGERTDALMRAHGERFLGPRLSWVSYDWLPGFWRRLTLEPPVQAELGATLARLLAHPSAVLLQGLEVEMARRPTDWQEVVAVAVSCTQRLRALVFRCPGQPGDSHTLEAAELVPLFSAQMHLGSLVLEGTLSTDALPELLSGAPWLPGLRQLDLTGGTLTDRGAEVLLSKAEHFRHLERLDLDSNRVDRMARALERALPQVRLGRQRR